MKPGLNRLAKIFGVVLFLFFAAPAQDLRDSFNRPRTFDARHYEIRTSFDRDDRKVFGETTVTLSPLKNGFGTFDLDAVGLDFESVKMLPDGRELKYKTEDDRVTITLDREYKAGVVLKVSLKYSAKPKKGVKFVNAVCSGEITHDAQIWTQGEPEYSRYWFPSYDFPDDKATTEQFLTVEQDETAVSNGDLIGKKQNNDGTTTFHFRMNIPHSVYLTSFIVGKYERTTDTFGKIPLGFYVYPGKQEIAKLAFGNTARMMGVFEDLTGVAFPFAKYDQTIVAQFNLGGMENVAATTYSDKEIFFVEKNRFVVEDLVSHELAHSWFGNLVTCRNWAELWLNEGFATFMEAAMREKLYGRDEYVRKIREDADIYFLGELDSPQKRGLYNLRARPDDTIFDAITYQKGAVVIHMLRETVGDKVFWKAVNTYLRRHKLGNVTTEDLRRVFEETSKKDLGWFFDQWVYGTRFPRLEVVRAYDENRKILKLEVQQTQKTDQLTTAAFYLPLDLEIKTETRTTTERIVISKREQVIEVPLQSRPLTLAFDKDFKIPLKFIAIRK